MSVFRRRLFIIINDGLSRSGFVLGSCQHGIITHNPAVDKQPVTVLPGWLHC